MELNDVEKERYARHIVMPEIGEEGQKRLKEAKVLIIGAGGLGGVAALYLAAAGVGTIGMVDYDIVSESNLQRQVIYTSRDAEKSKLDSAESRLKELNPFVKIDKYEGELTADNALEIIGHYDIVIDGSDNFQTKYLVNDACVLLGKPDIYGSVLQFDGQASIFYAKEGPCYRCLVANPPKNAQTCSQVGVLGAVPGVIGNIQAIEAIKLILVKRKTLVGRLLLFDALGTKFREFKVVKNPNCPACGKNPTIKELSGNKQESKMEDDFDMKVEELKETIDTKKDILLLDVREEWEHEMANISGSTLIPLNQLEERIDELPTDKDIIVYCHSGGRSAFAVSLLREKGFAKSKNLSGGIDAWSRKIDPKVPRY